ncbi:MAG: glycoside hydrolase family 92 protein, partial [Bacteroidaceae bacterium]|nr:glycoside hydrolase family 92 protein [Bacteroidaceae bacterium]
STQAILHFNGLEEPLVCKMAISIHSLAQARKNMELETAADGFDFDTLHQHAVVQWKDKLERMAIKGGTPTQRTNFYTALYHSFVVPNTISDAADKERRFSTLSLWDTFRAWNPLMTMLDTTVVNDIIASCLDVYDRTGELPIWPLSDGETNCMIGYHSVSVIADAYQKGIRGYDVSKALEAMAQSAVINKKGADYYTKYGYIPSNIKKESVSCLLEFAYDDWCIAQVAKNLGEEQTTPLLLIAPSNLYRCSMVLPSFLEEKR